MSSAYHEACGKRVVAGRRATARPFTSRPTPAAEAHATVRRGLGFTPHRWNQGRNG
jgi:hypothetical protein